MITTASGFFIFVIIIIIIIIIFIIIIIIICGRVYWKNLDLDFCVMLSKFEQIN